MMTAGDRTSDPRGRKGRFDTGAVLGRRCMLSVMCSFALKSVLRYWKPKSLTSVPNRAMFLVVL